MHPRDKFYSLYEGVIRRRFPDAKIVFKNTSRFMRFLGAILYFFNPKFMTHYTTVIGTTIYFPSHEWLESNYENALSIISHEYVHMIDESKMPFGIYKFMYLFPQILVIFSLFAFLAFWNSWCLFFLGFLIFILPWPAAGRTWIEARGYSMTMFFSEKTISGPYNANLDARYLSRKFTGSSYYWMCRDRDAVVDMLLYNYQALNNP